MVVHALPFRRRLVPLLVVAILAAAACKPGTGDPSPTSAATMAVARTAEPARTPTPTGEPARTPTPTGEPTPTGDGAKAGEPAPTGEPGATSTASLRAGLLADIR